MKNSLANKGKSFKFVFNYIQEHILPNMEVGEKLIAERELSEMIGVSRPTLREAKIALWGKGLISIEQGKPSIKL
jgi:DNA-binding FadR family transcriptional regulator